MLDPVLSSEDCSVLTPRSLAFRRYFSYGRRGIGAGKKYLSVSPGER